MQFQQDVSLSQYSTMRLGGKASYLLEVTDAQSVVEATKAAAANNIPILMIGGGSNIIWRDEGFNGLVLVNKIAGFEVVSEDESQTSISIGAGENWDSVVERTVNLGLSGIECLSLIPGTAGATPIQNVGAYGQEISQTLATVTAYDQSAQQMVTIANPDCGFSYRSSIFKSAAKNRYLITGLSLVLSKVPMMPPFYPSLANYLEQRQISDNSPASLRQAVINIRQQKLPDPASTPNCGSFFANPIVDVSLLSTLQDQYGAVPNWPAKNNTIKLSAAWLIEQAGFKDYFDSETGIATWPNQPLVFVNQSAKSTSDLLKFADKISSAVKQRFGIELEREPLLLP